MAFTAVWPTSRFGFSRFFIEFGLDSILNKQKIIKKIAFLVKMAKIVNFRPNHNIFSSFVGRSGKKKSIQKFLEKIKFNENHKYRCAFKKSPFSTHSTHHESTHAESTLR
jgi:hypothetical protein